MAGTFGVPCVHACMHSCRRAVLPRVSLWGWFGSSWGGPDAACGSSPWGAIGAAVEGPARTKLTGDRSNAAAAAAAVAAPKAPLSLLLLIAVSVLPLPLFATPLIYIGLTNINKDAYTACTPQSRQGKKARTNGMEPNGAWNPIPIPSRRSSFWSVL